MSRRRTAARERPVWRETSAAETPDVLVSKDSMTFRPRARERTKSGLPSKAARSLWSRGSSGRFWAGEGGGRTARGAGAFVLLRAVVCLVTKSPEEAAPRKGDNRTKRGA